MAERVREVLSDDARNDYGMERMLHLGGRLMYACTDRRRLFAIEVDAPPPFLVDDTAGDAQASTMVEYLTRQEPIEATVRADVLRAAMAKVEPDEHPGGAGRGPGCLALLVKEAELWLVGKGRRRCRLADASNMPGLTLLDADYLRFALQDLSDDQVTFGLHYRPDKQVQIRRAAERHVIMAIRQDSCPLGVWCGQVRDGEIDVDLASEPEPDASLVRPHGDLVARCDAAERAVRHLLDRAQSDPALYHLIGWGTESFRLLTLSEALTAGETHEAVEKRRRSTSFTRSGRDGA